MFYCVQFSTHYDTLSSDQYRDDYSCYSCLAHFSTYENALEWFNHYSYASTNCDDPTLLCGINYTCHRIHGPNDPITPNSPNPNGIDYKCNYDHSYWDELVVGEIEEHCEQ
jgi:hypothetical protein